MFSQLNLNHLRVFQSVYSHKSMTRAAQSLFLTQSGVSQHIKNLEDSLNITLFDRVGKKLIPTSLATYLYQECVKSMEMLGTALFTISQAEIQGVITIGAPPEFAQNILSPLLAKLQNKYPGIVVNLQIGFASQMIEALLGGKQDMAFMDDFGVDPRLLSQKVFDEHLELCATHALIKSFPCKKTSLPPDLPLLDYLPGEPTLRKWYSHHLGKNPSKLNVVAYLSNSQNVARMVILGRGAGILTGHHIRELRAVGHDIKPIIINKNPLINPISLNKVRNKTESALEKAVSHFLLQAFL